MQLHNLKPRSRRSACPLQLDGPCPDAVADGQPVAANAPPLTPNPTSTLTCNPCATVAAASA